MEKLDTVHSTASAEVSTAGIATYPDIIEVATRTPGRVIKDDIAEIAIRNSWHFFDVKNASKNDRSPYARLLYLNGADQGAMPTNLLPRHPVFKKIYPPRITQQYREKVSVGGIIQYTNHGELPRPGLWWAAMLYMDEDPEAATAAFSIDGNDNLTALMRSSRSPQLERHLARQYIDQDKKYLAHLVENEGLSEADAGNMILQRFVNEFDLHCYSGQLNMLRLYKRDLDFKTS